MAAMTRYDISDDRRTVTVAKPCSRCGFHGTHLDLDGHFTCKTPADQALISAQWDKARKQARKQERELDELLSRPPFSSVAAFWAHCRYST